jgi:16S rRNA processing protein RimM
MLVPDGAKAGWISKPYGLRGEVQIILEPEAGNYLEPDYPLFIELDGQRVPFFVEEVVLVSTDQAIVKFEFIDSLEEARKVAGSSLFFDSKRVSMPEKKVWDLSSLVGYLATDIYLGELGKIDSYLSHDMNPVFVIHRQGRDMLVPAVEDFIERIDPETQKVHFILPEGLSEL